MKPRLYLETTIISYLAALPSRDLITAAHQQITHEWWAVQRDRYELHVSEVVLREVRGGDPNAAARRIGLLDGLKSLDVNEEVKRLAGIFLSEGCLPRKAGEDAVHLALATVHGMDYLLTWNCRHIANAVLRQRVVDVCRQYGFLPPIISTPEELPEEEE